MSFLDRLFRRSKRKSRVRTHWKREILPPRRLFREKGPVPFSCPKCGRSGYGSPLFVRTDIERQPITDLPIAIDTYKCLHCGHEWAEPGVPEAMDFIE